MFRLCLSLFVALLAPISLAQTAASCPQDGATPTPSLRISPDGQLLTAEGQRLRLANLLWPDHVEAGMRAQLVNTLDAALKDQIILWKPAASPDRWGVTPAHLFVQEKHGTHPPFLLQAGLVETGLVPVWPAHTGPCLTLLETHERLAINARRGYWAPRAQSARHRQLEIDKDQQTGRRIAALWRVRQVRPWRGLFFVNMTGLNRKSVSLAMTKSQVSRLSKAGDNPLHWGGKRVLVRIVLPPAGLSRSRIESIDHIRRLD